MAIEVDVAWPTWRLLALDVGSVRIGVAVSDPSGTVVSERGIIRRQPTAQALARIQATIAEEEAVGVIVGLPLSLSGEPSDQTRATQAFAVQIAAQIAVPLVLWDERYTTTEAERILRDRGVRRDRWRDQIDAVAAAVILQDYLDAHITPVMPPPDVL